MGGREQYVVRDETGEAVSNVFRLMDQAGAEQDALSRSRRNRGETFSVCVEDSRRALASYRDGKRIR